jgi:hypothetical protein
VKREMPRGYGMRGGVRSWHHGHGYCWPDHDVWSLRPDEMPDDVMYIGPCHCGFGPHAYYRTSDGGTVHAAALPYVREATTAEPEPTYSELEAEVRDLRNRLQELESRFKETSEASKR